MLRTLPEKINDTGNQLNAAYSPILAMLCCKKVGRAINFAEQATATKHNMITKER